MAKKLENHPYAGIFPFHAAKPKKDGKPDKWLELLAADIKEHGGLLEPITLLDGKVLDGRRRIAACEWHGIEPEFVEFDASKDGDPLDFVIARNSRRRDMDAGKRAVAAALLANLGEGRPSKETAHSVRSFSQADAAKRFGASRRMLQKAKRVFDSEDADLSLKLQDGRISLGAAYKLLFPPEPEPGAEEAEAEFKAVYGLDGVAKWSKAGGWRFTVSDPPLGNKKQSAQAAHDLSEVCAALPHLPRKLSDEVLALAWGHMPQSARRKAMDIARRTAAMVA
jgi:hypothetical protein